MGRGSSGSGVGASAGRNKAVQITADHAPTAQAKYRELEQFPFLTNPNTNLNVNGNRDRALEIVQKMQGWTGPQVVDSNTLDQHIQNGEVEIFRALRGQQAKDWTDDFKDGKYFGGLGSFGNGTYTTDSRTAAKGYLRSGQGEIMRMSLKSDAVIGNFQDLRKEAEAEFNKKSAGLDAAAKKRLNLIYSDPGRYAAMKGYDAIEVPLRNEGKVVENYYVLLNHSAVRIQKDNL